MSEILLKNKVEAFQGEKPLGSYSARLTGEGELQFGEPFPNGEVRWLPGWFLNTLLKSNCQNILWIDKGAWWFVTGVQKVLEEVKETGYEHGDE